MRDRKRRSKTKNRVFRSEFFDQKKKAILGRLLCIRKTYTKMDQIRFFFRDQKHERRPSHAYGFGLICFRQTRTGLPMRVRYSNEIAEWKWPPIFQNKRVIYARKSKRAGPLQDCIYQSSALAVDEHEHSPARMRYTKFEHHVQNYRQIPHRYCCLLAAKIPRL